MAQKQFAYNNKGAFAGGKLGQWAGPTKDGPDARAVLLPPFPDPESRIRVRDSRKNKWKGTCV